MLKQIISGINRYKIDLLGKNSEVLKIVNSHLDFIKAFDFLF